MLDKLFSLIGLHKTNVVLNHVVDLLEHIEDEYEKDINAKNTAIDTVIDLLQKHKSQKE